ncbi:hypothetical protein K488DRAFT_77618 [Vararia minispora EC-137]|uniref:Uncharacterized protein n=1 Tax=Vararia minispora EC-137 TaxID=1314806 RepID=A0ACB8QQB9_9AGAM|nr:hypothetical protein K488DRAFT_77618 [Vararia minispora EC-137]
MAHIPFPHTGYSEDIFRRVRVLFGGQFVANAETPKLAWERPLFPTYFFRRADVKADFLRNPSASVDGATVYDLVVGEKTAQGAVTEFASGPFAGLVKILPSVPDAWFEENERMVWVYPRDPYKRLTFLPSSKHIRVEIDGVEVANSTRFIRLYETGHAIRTYLPMTDVRLDLLTPSTQTSICQYKGEASYFDVNLPSGTKHGYAWWYKSSTAESQSIVGLIAFYDEKLDVWADGVKQDRSKFY